MEPAIKFFNRRFRKWKITIPKSDVVARRRGAIQRQGWDIQYVFGADESGEYLDYYAAHRMTDDVHLRVRANGQVEELPAIASMFVTSEDPGEAQRLQEAYFERNRRVAEMLDAKGFGLTINGMLRTGFASDTPSGQQSSDLK